MEIPEEEERDKSGMRGVAGCRVKAIGHAEGGGDSSQAYRRRLGGDD